MRSAINLKNLEMIQSFCSYYECLTRCQSIDIDEIRNKTEINDTLNFVIKALRHDSWPKNSPSFYPFSKVSQEFCVQNNILLKSVKIMLPKTLYKKALSLVHQNHWGIEKMCSVHMVRESFWWPKINNDVEDQRLYS